MNGSDKTAQAQIPIFSLYRHSSLARVMSLADLVYEGLHDAMLTGALAPGDRIVEQNIAEQMATSLSPVREALQRLEREGLVARQARTSTFVTGVSLDEMRELFIARSTIEALAIHALANVVTDKQITELRVVVEEMTQEGERDGMLALVKLDRVFHSSICEWSGRTTLKRAWVPLYSQIQRFIVQTHAKFFSIEEIAQTHVPIVDALSSRDGDAAAQEVEKHIMLIWSMIGTEKLKVL